MATRPFGPPSTTSDPTKTMPKHTGTDRAMEMPGGALPVAQPGRDATPERKPYKITKG